MIDFKTLKFMKLLAQLAVLTANGIRPFSAADDDTKDDFLFYDETKRDEDGAYPIVIGMQVDEQHHDIVSDINTAYDIDPSKCSICIKFDDDDMPYVEIEPEVDSPFYQQGYRIIIENGTWYFA